jgi:succinate dehydrogenase / fumarate reductase cytochrome b subunit
MKESPRRPTSPHLQVYRPQLTSVLSFGHRLSGLTLGIYSIALVAWLVAAAAGPQPFSVAQAFMQSPFGFILLFAGSFCFFLHLCGGIRHLFWDSGRGFELGAIYASGWAVVTVSTALTLAAWVVSFILAR